MSRARSLSHDAFPSDVSTRGYSLAAAPTAIQLYRTEAVADHIWEYGDRLRAGIHGVCRDLGIAGECTGPPFRMQFIFRELDPARRQLKRGILLQELFKRRIITFHCMFLSSYAHDDHALRQTDAVGGALEVIATGRAARRSASAWRNSFQRRMPAD